MAYRSLRDFIERLEAAGELVRVAEPVSTVLEMTEICARLVATGGPAVLFESPIRADGERLAHPLPRQPVRHGQARRHGRDAGRAASARPPSELREVGELLAFLRQPEPPRGMKEALDLLPLARTVMGMRPKTVGARPCRRWCSRATTSTSAAARSRPAGRASRRR